MRLTELLGAEVVDQAGRPAGRVHDVRLVQDGPLPAGGFGASLRLDGLIVGRRAVGARLGYDRSRMRGPLPVKLLFGWVRHDGRYVTWDRVERLEDGRVLISGSADDLPVPEPSS